MRASSKASHRGLRNEMCVCNKAVKAIKRVARPGCPDDDDAVATLPDNWVPRHSGPILANYLKKQEQDHKKVLDDIAKGAAVVNEDVDKRVRTLSENLLSHIQQNQRDMDCLVDKYDVIEGPLTVEARDAALKDVHAMFVHRIEDMTTYNREALVLERERADKLRILLRGQFQRLVAVGHRTPKELLHEFDERIYDINQQLLSNSRAYSQLEAELRIQADESIMLARSSLNQLCLGIKMAYRGRSALIWCKDEKFSRQRSASTIDRNRNISDPSLGRILNDVGEFDAMVTRLVQAYRNAVLRVFTGFSSKLIELEKNLGSSHDLRENRESNQDDFADLQRFLERPLQRLSSNINKTNPPNKRLMEMTGADALTMQKSLCSLGESLRETYFILNHAGHLWDAHILRSALAQKLTIAAVEDLLTSNDAIELANEVPLDIALEHLRCSPDAEKLQQQYDIIVSLLDRTADMYLQHSEAELKRLEEFMNLPPIMANTLLAEFDCFLDKYPRVPLQTGSLTKQTAPTTPKRSPSIVSSLQMPLPRAILQTELQELALQNWKNGFLESFKNNVSLVPEELRHQAGLWVAERTSALQVRYSMKMVSHGIRYERVKAARDARLREIRYHDARLESHLNAIFNLVEHLPVVASEFAALNAPILYPICDWIERMNVNIQNTLSQDPLDPEVKKMKMKSYAPRLAKHRQLFEESLNAAVAECKQQLEHRIQEARISNVRFISQIKLFSEGGRYAANEATKTCIALGKGSDALELCISKALDALNQRRIQLLALADHQILPLQRVVEETFKTTGKQAGKSTAKIQDKKKPGKKK